jgi:hypothetical protein
VGIFPTRFFLILRGKRQVQLRKEKAHRVFTVRFLGKNDLVDNFRQIFTVLENSAWGKSLTIGISDAIILPTTEYQFRGSLGAEAFAAEQDNRV